MTWRAATPGNGAPLTRTPPRRSWGRGPSPPGWRRIQARRLTCLLLRAVQRRRVESLVLGALSSSPVHRTLVLVSGTNIAELLCCCECLDSVAFITYLLTFRNDNKQLNNLQAQVAGVCRVFDPSLALTASPPTRARLLQACSDFLRTLRYPPSTRHRVCTSTLSTAHEASQPVPPAAG